MVSFATNVYEKLGKGCRGYSVFAMQTRYFKKYILLASTSRLNLKSNAVCVCMHPPLFEKHCLLSLDVRKSTENIILCGKKWPCVIILSK